MAVIPWEDGQIGRWSNVAVMPWEDTKVSRWSGVAVMPVGGRSDQEVERCGCNARGKTVRSGGRAVWL